MTTTMVSSGRFRPRRSSRRPKVLCLGVSYADVEGQLLRQRSNGASSSAGASTSTPTPPAQHPNSNNNDTVAAAIASVQTGLLTQMDGRDLVRCRSTEQACQVDVYTVSQEKGSAYRSDRHLDANFNRHDFVLQLQRHFPQTKFQQVILDYFWIPAGWDAVHWSRSFFAGTLVKLSSMLTERTGVIYLPFCLHCFQQVHSSFDVLRKNYNISFVRKGQLEDVALWKGTQAVDAAVMQGVLGKHKSQEETYCTFGPRDVWQAMDHAAVSKHELVELARTLEDFGDIRFIKLEQLPKQSSSDCGKPFLGSFLGCMDPARVKRGFDQMMPSSPTGRAGEPGCKRNLFGTSPRASASKKKSSRATKAARPVTKKKRRRTASPCRSRKKSKSAAVSASRRQQKHQSRTKKAVPATPSSRRQSAAALDASTPRVVTPAHRQYGFSTRRSSSSLSDAATHGYPTRRTSRRSTPTNARGAAAETLPPRSPSVARTDSGFDTTSMKSSATSPSSGAILVDHRYPTRSRSPCTVALLALPDKPATTKTTTSSRDGARRKKQPVALFS